MLEFFQRGTFATSKIHTFFYFSFFQKNFKKIDLKILNVVDGSFSLEGLQSKYREIHSHAEIEKNQLNETSVKKRNREEQPPSVIDGCSSMEGLQSKYCEIPSHAKIGMNINNMKNN
jgi:hypothetical protein